MPLPLVTANPNPGNYIVGTMNPDSLVNPDNTVVAAQRITGTEANYGVFFAFTVPQTVFDAGLVLSQLDSAQAVNPSIALRNLLFEYANVIYAWGSLAPVSAMYYLQLVAGSQALFTDNMVVTVSTPDLTSSSEVVVVLDPAKEAAGTQAINNTYAQLVANLGV